MNCIDLAEIFAASMGLPEADHPNVLHIDPPADREQHIDRLWEIIRESDARKKRITAARKPADRHPWRKAVIR